MAAHPGAPARGLSAAELALAVAELRPSIESATVLDVALLQGPPPTSPLVDDLLLVLESAHGGTKVFVHVALGAARARVTTTARRFARALRATGPKADAMQQALAGARVLALDHDQGERSCTFVFARGDAELRLCVELFSARGLWALCDGSGTVREMSRPVATAVRTLRPGSRYEPPPRREAPAPRDDAGDRASASRFAAPVLAAIDASFTAQDLADERAGERTEWRRATERALQRLQRKLDGLRQQLVEADRADLLRAEADLMLAYAHTVVRGAASMTVPDPEDDGAQRTIALDPGKPVFAQAEARYDRARRLAEGRAIAAERLAEGQRQAGELGELLTRLDDPRALDDGEREAALAQLRAHGALPKTAAPATRKPPAKKPADRKLLGLSLRRFRSIEGYEVLVGRDNEQNDKLSTRIARGNDVWLHVGGGRAGSHVLVRLPKEKTASLETLLDAATLAVHFSKSRGEHVAEVIYTLAKHVRKPKGLPPGAVVPAQVRSLTVRRDEDRLRRLLASGDDQG